MDPNQPITIEDATSWTCLIKPVFPERSVGLEKLTLVTNLTLGCVVIAKRGTGREDVADDKITAYRQTNSWNVILFLTVHESEWMLKSIFYST